jgi:hypothetical protein
MLTESVKSDAAQEAVVADNEHTMPSRPRGGPSPPKNFTYGSYSFFSVQESAQTSDAASMADNGLVVDVFIFLSTFHGGLPMTTVIGPLWRLTRWFALS